MEEKTLVVLAAGMGSRFGGMKQIEPVGPNGEYIIDYSIYSAIKYGFNKIIFVIREENLDVFKNTISKRIENKVKVEYAFQKIDDIPINTVVLREKPWGTAHALYATRFINNQKFAVISSDDFYGDEAFSLLADSLKNNDFSIIGYTIGNTVSVNGSVNRGIIKQEDGKVVSIKECSCTIVNNKIQCSNKNSSFIVDKKTPVFMLMFTANKDFISFLESFIINNLNDSKENLLKKEILLPDAIKCYLQNGNIVKLKNTNSRWMGITYKSDLDNLKEHIKNEIKKGTYPNNLWK